MRQLLQKLHTRIGDFWWYSLMLFVACRAADLLNAFVGLWLVPKYVDPSELGAVLPLSNFANFLAIPIAAFAYTFRNEVSRLSVGREFGKLKTLMRGVFIATAIFLFLAIIVARFTMPLLLERIRIVEGSLGVVIIATSFVGTVSPIYTSALQALKKFREQSIINVIGAPVRLITMLIAMPFRAITGYFVGQAATPAFSIIATTFSLKKEFSAKAEPYWNNAIVKRFTTIFVVFMAWTLSSGFYLLVESTVLRQRLPDLDSAGYYMASRFSEISTYVFAALSAVLFPIAADLAKDSKAHHRLVAKSIVGNFIFCAIIGGIFCLFGRQLLAFLPHDDQYSAYWWAIPWLVAISAICAIEGFFGTAEVAAGRFGYLKWIIPINLAYPALLLLVTGYGYFANIIPASWYDFLNAHNIRSLDTMLWWMTTVNVIKATICLIAISRRAEGAKRVEPFKKGRA